MPLRFTLFNAITLLIVAVTLVTGVALARRKLTPNWPFAYYLLIVAYWKVFEGALNTLWVFAGLSCAVLLRFRVPGGRVEQVVWWGALAALAYIFLRGVDLILGGELSYLLFHR
ncbi:MAG: hypothetical protein K6T59_04250 [Bryobacteraceae bacterium]|jgi:hypothetical protein|nr:hypothetical protein [Bryobacteraceae bacterium]